jgi:cytochrome o ubiquinol oxidase subunit III
MFRGRIRFELPMLWVMGFIPTFVLGGLTGVLLAVPPADFVLHNSLFLVAHFHNVIIGGVVFGLLSGVAYWFPKAFGYKLDPFWGKVSFWCWLVGFWVTFMPIYIVGLMGYTRRTQHFDDPTVQPLLTIAAVGAFIIMGGILAFVVQLVVSFFRREQLRDLTGDPWGGRTLEWSTSSPPPPYNFAFTPVVHDLDAWWDMKKRGSSRPLTDFRPIHMPKNTETGSKVCGPRSSQQGLEPMHEVTAPPGATAPVFYEQEEHAHGDGGTLFGFWLYLMSDCLLFAVLFATYGVLGRNFAAGPSGADLFDLRLVAVNTGLLLLSSITYGFAMLEMDKGRSSTMLRWLAVTGLLGAAFVAIEIYEFAHLIHEGATPQRSAFLSSFYALVGTHGLHVTFGIVWLVTLMVQVRQHGLIPDNQRRLMCLSMFWHFLDVIWIGVFTFVYLMGAMR